MPDTLNPASVRAACDAMRAAYRPDGILLRPDAMEAAIGAFLAAEAERGWGMRPREPSPEYVAAFWRVKNGHHFPDEPPPTDTSDYAAYRAMWDAAAIGAKP